MSYRCEYCKKWSGQDVPQFMLVTEKQQLDKGWKIKKTMKVCDKCYEYLNNRV